MKDEFLVALKNRLGIGAGGIDPEFQHAAGTGERAGNSSVALDLAGIADIDDHDVIALRRLDGVRGAYRFDLRIGFIDQGLDTAVNGLGHWSYTPDFCHSGMVRRTRPGISRFRDGPKDQTRNLEIPGSRVAR